MRSLRALGISSLIAIVFAGGCIAAVRKGIGTLRGTSGSMEITHDGGDIQQGEMIYSVTVQQDEGVGVPEENFKLVSDAVQTALKSHSLYNASSGDLRLDLNVTRYVNRPGKKVLDITATLSRGNAVIGTADTSANLDGFGTSEEVAEAIGKATLKFLNQINDD